jgi:hypothetical protein
MGKIFESGSGWQGWMQGGEVRLVICGGWWLNAKHEFAFVAPHGVAEWVYMAPRGGVEDWVDRAGYFACDCVYRVAE